MIHGAFTGHPPDVLRFSGTVGANWSAHLEQGSKAP